MQLLLSLARPAMATVLSCALLSACGTVGPRRANPNPIIERPQAEVRLVCPSALGSALPPVGPVPAGAIVRHNAEGGDWLDRKVERGEAAETIVDQARADCIRKGIRP